MFSKLLKDDFKLKNRSLPLSKITLKSNEFQFSKIQNWKKNWKFDKLESWKFTKLNIHKIEKSQNWKVTKLKIVFVCYGYDYYDNNLSLFSLAIFFAFAYFPAHKVKIVNNEMITQLSLTHICTNCVRFRSFWPSLKYCPWYTCRVDRK